MTFLKFLKSNKKNSSFKYVIKNTRIVCSGIFIVGVVLILIELNLRPCWLDITSVFLKFDIFNTFFKNFVHDLDGNLINLYISQISTTFLVTAFLSFLGGKDTLVYWTTAMDYKLVHPQASSLRDFTLYSFFTLIVSLIALFLEASISLLCSFLINVWCLAIITWRMIITFYDRDGIKKDLKEQFDNMNDKEKQKCLHIVEENMVRASHNHDIEYLRESVEFLGNYLSGDILKKVKDDITKTNGLIIQLKTAVSEDGSVIEKIKKAETNEKVNEIVKSLFEKYNNIVEELYENFKKSDVELSRELNYAPVKTIEDGVEYVKKLSERVEKIAETAENPHLFNAYKKRIQNIGNGYYVIQMLHYIQIIPCQFVELRLNAIKFICKEIGIEDLVVDDPEERISARKKHLKKALENPCVLQCYNYSIAFELRESIIHVLREAINEGSLSEQSCQLGLDMLLAIQMEDFEYDFNSEIRYRYLEGKPAYTIENSLTPNSAVMDFNKYFGDFIYLFKEAYQNHKRVDSYAVGIVNMCNLIEYGLKELQIITYRDDKDSKKQKVFDERVYFTMEEAEMIFENICSKDSLYNDYYNICAFVENVAKYTDNLNEENINKLKEILKRQCSLETIDKDYVASLLDENHNKS